MINHKKVSIATKFFLAFGFFLMIFGTASKAANLGERPPLFMVQTADGESFSLEKYKGKVVYLDFWASWCGPCRQSFPWMNDIHDKYSRQGLEVLAVNLDGNKADAIKFLLESPAKFNIAYDSKALSPRLLGVKGMPTSFLIDKNGRLVSVHVGFNPAQKNDLESEIKRVLEGQ